MESPVVSLLSASEPLIVSLSARSKDLLTFFCRRHSQIARSGTSATWLSGMISIGFTCRLFDSMFEVIVAVIYRNLMCVYSRCLHFCNGSCASLCIIDVSRDKIVENILEINATVQKTVKTMEICMTNVKETSAMNQLKWVITFWDVLTTESHHWTHWSIVEDSKSVTRTICGECGDGSVSGVHFQKPISLLLMKNHQHVWLRELHQMQIDNKTLYSKYLSSAKEPLELVHSVICGSPQIALRGTLYMLLFIEDITRHAVEYILLYKSEAMEILFKELTASKEKELGKQVKQCWTAGGGE